MATTTRPQQNKQQQQQQQQTPPADNTPAKLNPRAPIGTGKALAALLKGQGETIRRVTPRTSGLTPERMIQLAAVAVSRDSYLLKCSGLSLLAAVTKAAELGLDCSGTLGGAYLVPFKGEATLIIGYRGMIDLARRSGQVASIEARAVYTGDEFDVVYGTEPRIVHRPALDRGAGVFRLVYAVAHLSGGGTQFEILTGAEIEAVRRRSATGKSEKSPWSTDYEAMAKKSAIRRLFKTLPVSIDVRQAFADDEDREFRGDRGPAVPPADVNAMLGSRPAAPDGGDDAGDVTDPPDDDLGPDTGDGDPDVVDAEETGAADAG